jgi:hypothetical protein
MMGMRRRSGRRRRNEEEETGGRGKPMGEKIKAISDNGIILFNRKMNISPNNLIKPFPIKRVK